jgi:GGDEF domain-containing protein
MNDDEPDVMEAPPPAAPLAGAPPTWDAVAPQMIQAFPDLDPAEMRRQYDARTEPHRRMAAARQDVANHPEQPAIREAAYWMGRSVPFLSSVVSAGTAERSAAARQRIEEGRPERWDYHIVASQEQMDAEDQQRRSTFGGAVLDTAASLPAVLGEYAAGAGIVGNIGRGGGMLARLGGRALQGAAATPFIPSTYVPRMMQDNAAAGRDPLDPRGLPPAIAMAAAENAVLGSLGEVTRAVIPGQGIGARLGRVGAGAVAMPLEQAAVDVVGGALHLQTGYGTIGEFVNGDKGEAWKQLAIQAMVGATFSAWHEATAPRPAPVQRGPLGLPAPEARAPGLPGPEPTPGAPPGGQPPPGGAGPTPEPPPGAQPPPNRPYQGRVPRTVMEAFAQGANHLKAAGFTEEQAQAAMRRTIFAAQQITNDTRSIPQRMMDMLADIIRRGPEKAEAAPERPQAPPAGAPPEPSRTTPEQPAAAPAPAPAPEAPHPLQTALWGFNEAERKLKDVTDALAARQAQVQKNGRSVVSDKTYGSLLAQLEGLREASTAARDRLHAELQEEKVRRDAAQPQQPPHPPTERRSSTRPPQDLWEQIRAEHPGWTIEQTGREATRRLETSPLVDLPNRAAFDRIQKAKPGPVGMSDADGLKAVNDKYGHAAGDALLRAKAHALKAAGLDAYHVSGDEFVYRNPDPAKLERARAILRDTPIEFTDTHGKHRRIRGADFSYGLGADLGTAEKGMHQHKAQREAAGERGARGALGKILELPNTPAGMGVSPVVKGMPQDRLAGMGRKSLLEKMRQKSSKPVAVEPGVRSQDLTEAPTIPEEQKLDEREQKVLAFRSADPPLSLREIGRRMGISYETARLAEKSGLAKQQKQRSIAEEWKAEKLQRIEALREKQQGHLGGEAYRTITVDEITENPDRAIKVFQDFHDEIEKKIADLVAEVGEGKWTEAKIDEAVRLYEQLQGDFNHARDQRHLAPGGAVEPHEGHPQPAAENPETAGGQAAPAGEGERTTGGPPSVRRATAGGLPARQTPVTGPGASGLQTVAAPAGPTQTAHPVQAGGGANQPAGAGGKPAAGDLLRDTEQAIPLATRDAIRKTIARGDEHAIGYWKKILEDEFNFDRPHVNAVIKEARLAAGPPTSPPRKDAPVMSGGSPYDRQHYVADLRQGIRGQITFDIMKTLEPEAVNDVVRAGQAAGLAPTTVQGDLRALAHEIGSAGQEDAAEETGGGQADELAQPGGGVARPEKAGSLSDIPFRSPQPQPSVSPQPPGLKQPQQPGGRPGRIVRRGAIDISVFRDAPAALKSWWDSFYDMTEKLGGVQMPKTERLSPRAATSMVEWGASATYAKEAAPIWAKKIMGEGYSDNMDRKTAAALYELRFRYAKAALRKAANDALRAGDKAKAADYDNRAQKITSVFGMPGSLINTEKEFQYLIKTPVFGQIMNRYLEFGRLMDDLYTKANGRPPDSITQIPGLPFNAKVLEPGDLTGAGTVFKPKRGNLRNIKQKRDPFAEEAGLDAEAYDLRMSAMIENSLNRRVSIANRAEANRVLVAEGLGQWATRGDKVPELRGVPGREVPFVQPPRGTQQAAPSETSLYLHPDVYNEYREVLDIDDPWKLFPGSDYVAGALTKISLASTTEFMSHGSNLLSAMMQPGVRFRDIVTNFYKILTDNKGIRDAIVELARIGAMKDKGNETGNIWGGSTMGGLLTKPIPPQTDPTYWVGKLLDTFGRAMRLTLDDAYTRLAKAGRVPDTQLDRANWINKGAGNYNRLTYSRLVKFLKDTGIGPFAVAGFNFNMRAIDKAMLLRAGVRNLTPLQSAGLRASMLCKFLGLLIGTSAVNLILWGKWDGDDNTPVGSIKLGESPEGETIYLDPLRMVGGRRALNVTGAGAAIQGLREGKTGPQISQRMVSDIAMSAVHPSLGPYPTAIHTAITGEDWRGHRLADRAYADEHQILNNAIAALRTANPPIATLGGFDRPRQQQHATDAFRLLGPFGPQYKRWPQVK